MGASDPSDMQPGSIPTSKAELSVSKLVSAFPVVATRGELLDGWRDVRRGPRGLEASYAMQDQRMLLAGRCMIMWDWGGFILEVC